MAMLVNKIANQLQKVKDLMETISFRFTIYSKGLTHTMELTIMIAVKDVIENSHRSELNPLPLMMELV